MDLMKEMEALDPIKGEEETMPDEVMSPDRLLIELVTYCQTHDFIVMPLAGWLKTLKTIKDSTDENLLDNLNANNVPVIPLNLAPSEPEPEESLIITPNDMPKGDSKIII